MLSLKVLCWGSEKLKVLINNSDLTLFSKNRSSSASLFLLGLCVGQLHTETESCLVVNFMAIWQILVFNLKNQSQAPTERRCTCVLCPSRKSVKAGKIIPFLIITDA